MEDKINYERRNIYINEDIEEEISKKVIKEIIEINNYDQEQLSENDDYVIKPIHLYLTTSGGSIDEAMAIYDTIKYSKTPINIYALGKCYSAGFVILGAAKKRFSFPNTRFMAHETAYSTNWKKLEFHRDYIIEADEVQENINKLILNDTKISEKDLDWYYRHAKDWFMDAKEALRLGVIDEIIER